MATSLDDVLNEKTLEKPQGELPIDGNPESLPPEKPAVEAETAQTEKPTSRREAHRKRELTAQGRDPDTGQFVPVKAEEKTSDGAPPVKAEAGKPAAAAPQQDLTEKEKAFLRAAQEERAKRQQLEQELSRWRQPPQPQGQPGQQPQGEQPKSFWEDPEGYFKTQEQRLHQSARETVLRTAEMVARSKYPDFDEKIGAFEQMLQQVPGIAQQWLASSNPAEFAYHTGRGRLELAQAGSLDNLRAEIEKKARADERAKVEAEFKSKQEELDKKRAGLLPSLSDVRGASSQHLPAWGGPTPLEDVLKG